MEQFNQTSDRSQRLLLAAGFQFALLVLTFLLFLCSKGGISSSNFLAKALRSINVHAGLTVTLVMGICFVLTVVSARAFSFFKQSAARNFSFWVVFFFLAITCFPLGNRLKHHTFFFEKWMWYCALWFAFSNLSLTVSMLVEQKCSGTLNYFGRKFQGTHRFLQQSFSRKNDLIFIVPLMLWVGIVTSLVNWFVLGGIPHVQDSIAQFFQAKVFAHGFLALPSPDDPEFFERIYVVSESGKWYSIYPPGHALVLSLGVLAGFPFLVNPLISALTVPFFFLFARKHVSPFAARTGCLLLSLSPFYLMMGSGFMNHPTSLFFLTLFLLFFMDVSPKAPSFRTRFKIVAAGLFFGMAFLIRPMTALAFLTGSVLWTAIRFRSAMKRLVAIALLFVLGTVPPAIFYLTYNAHATGNPFLTGYEKYFGGNPLGFGKRPWGAEPLGPKLPNEVFHSPTRGLANTICNLNALNAYLFGWPVPSLLFAFLLFLPWMRRTPFDRWLIGSCFLVLLVYFFYFFQDYCYGPRFIYETAPLWALLSARGIEACLSRLRSARLLSGHQARGLVFSWLAIFFLIAFSTSWVERYNELNDDYWGARKEIAVMLRAGVEEKNAVIFVEDDYDYISAFSFLDPLLDRGWIVVNDCDPEANEAFLHRYREWPVYVLRLIENESTQTLQTVLEKIKPSQPPENTAILPQNHD